MTIPITRTFGAVEKHLPPELVGPSQTRDLRSATASVGDRLASTFGLECRLGQGGDGVDLAVLVPRAVIAGWGDEEAEGDAAPHEQLLRRLRRHVARGGTAGVEVLYAMWLGYDLPARSPSGLPAFWVQIDNDRLSDPAPVLDAVVTAMAEATGSDLDPEGVVRLASLLPEGAHVLHVGMFPARNPRALRLVVQGLTDERVPSFLSAAGWRGSTAELRGVMADFLPTPGSGHPNRATGLALDIEDGRVEDRVGLEYPVNGTLRFGRERLAFRFLDHLVERGLGSEAGLRGLLRWPGFTLEDLGDPESPGLLLRTVNHVKLVHEPERTPEVKAYLLALPLAAPDDPLDRARTLAHFNAECLGEIVDEAVGEGV